MPFWFRPNRFRGRGFLVAATDAGVAVTALQTTGLTSSGQLDLTGVEVPADRVVRGTAVLDWLAIDRTVGLTAYQLGVLERALELTAEYARPASSSTGRSEASRRSPSGLPTATSTSRVCA